MTESERKKPRWKRRALDGRRPNKEASCPYCGSVLPRPHPIGITATTGFIGGVCTCSAVYLLDENGFHGGEATVELLALVYGDWDTAWSKIPGEDYDETMLHYDERNHRIADPGDAYQPEAILYFVRQRNAPGPSGGDAS